MSFDISRLLEEWAYEPGQLVVRKFKTRSGTEKIQLRLDLGLLQMNALGRPDGKRPFGKESLLDHVKLKLTRYRDQTGSDLGFTLSSEEAGKLQQEAIQFHHRYICLFQLQEYDGVVRDAQRNLEAYDFLQRYAPAEDGCWSLQHLIPQLLMLMTRAQAMALLNEDDHGNAIQLVETGVDKIRTFYGKIGRPEISEQSGEILSLNGLLDEIRSKRPLSRHEQLQHALDEAIRREDYENAARIRDQIAGLNR